MSDQTAKPRASAAIDLSAMDAFLTVGERERLKQIIHVGSRTPEDEAFVRTLRGQLRKVALSPALMRAGPLHRRQALGDLTALPSYQAVARMKRERLRGTRCRLLCGRAHPCPAEIGIALNCYHPSKTPHLNASYIRGEDYGKGVFSRDTDWLLVAPSGFQGDGIGGFDRAGDGTFTVLRPRMVRNDVGQIVRARTGRGATPNAVHSGGGARGTLNMDKGIRGIVGWYPVPPCVVVCHTCNTRNLVEDLPEPEEWVKAARNL